MDIDRAIKWAGYAVVANFLIFAAISLYLGGDAIQGYSAGGHYFLKAPGHLREVTHGLFLYSEWHGISVLVSMPIMFMIQFAYRKPD